MCLALALILHLGCYLYVLFFIIEFTLCVCFVFLPLVLRSTGMCLGTTTALLCGCQLLDVFFFFFFSTVFTVIVSRNFRPLARPPG